MKFKNSNAEVYVPSNLDVDAALARTTHLAIGAHHDDLEVMAATGILECFQREDKWFTGVIVTDGRGSPRANLYADYSDEQMMEIRVREQKKAAQIGDYSAQVFLGYSSLDVKSGSNSDPVADLANLMRATTPGVVYTHNLADKHQTHVAVAVEVVQAIRKISPETRPAKMYGCEVWRGLDWMMDDEKIALDCSKRTNIQNALLSVFDSQVSGGKRYDLATMGRRLANATFFTSHAIENAESLAYAMDLSPLIVDDDLDIEAYVQGYIERFANDVSMMINKVMR